MHFLSTKDCFDCKWVGGYAYFVSDTSECLSKDIIKKAV